ILAHVKRIFSVVVDRGIAIRNYHLRERSAVQHGPLPPLILISDSVQDKAFSWRKADAETPFLPVNLIALDAKTRSIRLIDRQLFEVCTELLYCFSSVITSFRRQGHNPGILDSDDLHFIEVYQGQHAFNGASIAVISRIGAHPR